VIGNCGYISRRTETNAAEADAASQHSAVNRAWIGRTPQLRSLARMRQNTSEGKSFSDFIPARAKHALRSPRTGATRVLESRRSGGGQIRQYAMPKPKQEQRISGQDLYTDDASHVRKGRSHLRAQIEIRVDECWSQEVTMIFATLAIPYRGS